MLHESNSAKYSRDYGERLGFYGQNLESKGESPGATEQSFKIIYFMQMAGSHSSKKKKILCCTFHEVNNFCQSSSRPSQL